MYDITGVTLPVLKNEIEDFFFARLGTGRTYRYSLRRNACRHATTRLRMYTVIRIYRCEKYLSSLFFFIYLYTQFNNLNFNRVHLETFRNEHA